MVQLLDVLVLEELLVPEDQSYLVEWLVMLVLVVVQAVALVLELASAGKIGKATNVVSPVLVLVSGLMAMAEALV